MKREIFKLDFLDTGVASAQANMELDRELLEALKPEGAPLLHCYDWEGPSLTYGHFLKVEEQLNLDEARKRGLSWAQRPTGGGVVFHVWDFAFSFLMPAGHPKCSLNPLDNYRFVHEQVKEAVLSLFPFDEAPHLIPEDAPYEAPPCTSFCMARPTRYDLLYRGKKIAGAAQRRKKGGYLHQGTISLALPDLELLRRVLRFPEAVAAAMESYSFAPLGAHATPQQLLEARKKLKGRLFDVFAEAVQNLPSSVSSFP